MKAWTKDEKIGIETEHWKAQKQHKLQKLALEIIRNYSQSQSIRKVGQIRQENSHKN